jgi:hypothetical protein
MPWVLCAQAGQGLLSHSAKTTLRIVKNGFDAPPHIFSI